MENFVELTHTAEWVAFRELPCAPTVIISVTELQCTSQELFYVYRLSSVFTSLVIEDFVGSARTDRQ